MIEDSKVKQTAELLMQGQYNMIEISCKIHISIGTTKQYLRILRKYYGNDLVSIKIAGEKRFKYHIVSNRPYIAKPGKRAKGEGYVPGIECIDVRTIKHIPFPEKVMTKDEIIDWANKHPKSCKGYSAKTLFAKYVQQGGTLIERKKPNIMDYYNNAGFLNLKVHLAGDISSTYKAGAIRI